MKKILLLIFVLSLGMAGAGDAFAQKKKDKKKKKKGKSSLNDNVAMLKAMAGGQDEGAAMDFFMEGMKFYILEEYEKALPKFQEAAKLSSENGAIHHQLAQTLVALKRFDDALPSAQKALALDGSNMYYYTGLANIYKNQRNFAEAIKTYEQMTAKGLSKEDDYLDLANLYLLTNQADKAIKTYDAVEKKYGFDERIVRQKQRIHFQENNMEAALAEGQKLVEAFPNVPEYVIEQAQLLMSNGKTEECEKLLEEVLASNPEQVRAKFLLSDVYRQQGDEDKAQEVIQDAIASPLLDFSA